MSNLTGLVMTHRSRGGARGRAEPARSGGPSSRGPVGAATTTNTTATAAGTSASGPGARVCSGGAAAGAGREGHAASPGTSACPRARSRARAASRARGHRLRRAPSGHVHPGPAGEGSPVVTLLEVPS
ncbi:hypothetical protein EASAB2608_00009 [Streptomyces sp. EAS-AB2608]|nr:hypothetical protein EASAB2608_00009 [Streptomyces sp. EAS-AB2608]